MTTIIDPAGTPTVVFRSTDPVYCTVAATGSDGTDAAQLMTYSSRTVFLITTDDNNKGIKLPANSELADTIEIIGEPANPGYKIYDETGVFLGANNAVPRRLTRVSYGWT